jgi:putative acetyltransferase
MDSPVVELIYPQNAELLEASTSVLLEYAQSLAADLSFQSFTQELSGLPGPYAQPTGQFLLAVVDGAIAGCGAFCQRPEVDYPNACEMRSLYVRPVFRRFGLGRLLAQALLDDARRAGYSIMLLDTLTEMEAARGLYASLGFHEIAPYYFNPIARSHYLKVNLERPHARDSR